MKAYTGPPMTLSNAAAARVTLIVWCESCQHRVEPDPAEMAERYEADMPVPEWHDRLICSKCGSHSVDMAVTGPSVGHKEIAPAANRQGF